MKFFIAVSAFALLTGCSTLAETFDDRPRCGPHPYCGASTDIEVMKAATEDNAGVFRVLAPLAMIDLPFSLVADTLFLPYTAFNTGAGD
ncbi:MULTISPECIES: YceK/YidQ family lipoprotein [Pseudomonas]|uniref:YceK/YidQ family lipoprotein n=1 Tax=Pseudomonas TaxID=286 RepID=UPI001BECBAD9|nr:MULTISPECIES: YceK/YidQ family lipoprotein [Pseudomonas]MBT2337627.1 YceK/YidQ family lipoprotein [Pseudomonas fluorescens]MCD4527936.1 YceK/YidQ family lipoprotein [Pseudomonas sp. C3-2018]